MNLLKEAARTLNEDDIGYQKDSEEINEDEIEEFDDFVCWVIRNGAAIE